jgi:hypothetical protein
VDITPVEPRPAGGPEWIEATFRFTPGLDPIGIRALTAGRIVAPLVPGILALSDRARYLSLFTWLLWRYADQRRPAITSALSTYLLRREYEFGIAVRLCTRDCGSSPVGMDRIGPAISAQPAAYERNESVKSQLGGYGLYYRTPMRVMDLVRLPGTALGGEAIQIDVLNRTEPQALALAEAFNAAVADTAYVRDGYIDGDGPIPKEVLEEYGEAGCLCRLDEHPTERSILRAVYLDPTAGQAPEDVRNRREALGLFLDLLRQGQPVQRSDAHLRWAVWEAFEKSSHGGGTRNRVLTRWAALSAINFVQDGINLLWVDGGTHLRQADHGSGLAWPDISELVAGLVDVGNVEIRGFTVACTRDTSASSFHESIAQVTRSMTMQEIDLWAVEDRRAIAGVVLILAVLARTATPEEAGQDWLRIAAIDGQWQPGLLTVSRQIESLIADGATLGDLTLWLFEHLVLRAHERNAYSKIPDFTFRWRWEAGRLRFYNHPISWDVLADLRSASMGSLLRDLGYCEDVSDGLAVTSDGLALAAEVFE